MNIGCEALGTVFSGELPDAVVAMLKAQTVGVGLYVSQFPEWSRFTENAASIEFNEEDIRSISNAAQHLAADLSDRPDTVDPEVPKLLAFLHSLIQRPGASAKRAAFATLRTIENLVSKVFGYALDFADTTIKDSLNGASKAVAAAFTAVVAAAIYGALTVAPVAGKAGESTWMQTAAEYFQKRIEAELLTK